MHPNAWPKFWFAIEGRFVLSINDRAETRDLFGGVHCEPVRLKYTVSSGAGTDAKEMIVTDREVVAGLF
jgi:DNA adenine methylase